MALQVPIDKQSKIFKEHLEEQKNERIIFSGIFGIGKSYFLNKYFDIGMEEYLAINLKPINYSISNNEDIFRLVKYDILYELIFTHQLELVFESVSRSIAYGVALGEKIPTIIESLLPIIPLLNKEVPDFTPLLGIIKKIAPFINEVEQSKKDVNSNFKLEDFVKEIEKGYLFESDFITEFIEKSLNNLSSEKEKTKVLIIDDLDRIDPEHIFRLFNIFSAHLDYHKSTSNKFGFDKVIFVCDIDNIRNIFAAKYGSNVDFNGYIDKFYSTGIYYFNNNEEVAAFTAKIIKNINFDRFQEMIRDHILDKNEESTTNFLYIILKACINSGALNMRRIQAVYNSKFDFVEKHVFSFNNHKQINNKNIPVTIIFDILIWIFGDVKSLESALTHLVFFGRTGKQVQEVRYNTSISIYLEMLLPIIDSASHKFDVDGDFSDAPVRKKLEAKVNSKSIDLVYSLKIKNQEKFEIYFAELDNFNYRSNIEIELFEFILEAFKTLKTVNYF